MRVMCVGGRCVCEGDVCRRVVCVQGRCVCVSIQVLDPRLLARVVCDVMCR